MSVKITLQLHKLLKTANNIYHLRDIIPQNYIPLYDTIYSVIKNRYVVYLINFIAAFNLILSPMWLIGIYEVVNKNFLLLHEST